MWKNSPHEKYLRNLNMERFCAQHMVYNRILRCFLLQNLLFFVIYAVLLQGRSGHYLHAFAWRKLSQNCSCEEKMTNIRYVFEESRRVQHLIVSTQGNTGTHKDVPL